MPDEPKNRRDIVDEALEQRRLTGIRAAEELRVSGGTDDEGYRNLLSLHNATPEEVQAAREEIGERGGLRIPVFLSDDDGERIGAIATALERHAVDRDGRDVRYLRGLSKLALNPEAAEEAILGELRRRAPEEVVDALAREYPTSEDGSTWPPCGTCGDPVGLNATCAECVLRGMGLGGGDPVPHGQVWVCEQGHVDDGHHGDPTINPDQLCSRCGGICTGYRSLDLWARAYREISDEREKLREEQRGAIAIEGRRSLDTPTTPVDPPYPGDLLDALADALGEAVLASLPSSAMVHPLRAEGRQKAREALDRYTKEIGWENGTTTVHIAIAELGGGE